ncbi:hypothetical protein [Glycomyces buryatensis]|uniref:Uncharacterized protein n=1 Tax=Glycomyces buryatensis TaxID=2570927 RepID=A0A4S8QAK8_9ACTN|nr:hypothetical protein [Glycomyces buryatensis]THV41300.1 hypothetical protein FAB82_12100 [Glycomyces buryatensis]
MVIDRLREVGVHAFREIAHGGFGAEPGVEVRIDSQDDAGRGVYLEWNLGAEIHNARVEAMLAQRFDDPIIWDSGAEQAAKTDEVAAILERAGVRTEDPENDFAPFALRVVSV